MSDGNYAIWKGKEFWCGAYDVKTERITEVHTFKECEAVDFNSYWCFTVTGEEKFESGEWIFFWVEENTNINTEYDVDVAVIRRIRAQISTEEQETPERTEEDICGLGARQLMPADGSQGSRRQSCLIVWIPVDEDTPKDDGIKLVTCKPKKGEPNVNRAYYDGQFWHGSGSMSGVTAWAEPPQPYRA